MGCWKCRDAKIDGHAVHGDAGTSILWPQSIGDVESGDDLDARGERRRQRARQPASDADHAVDPMPNDNPLLFRLDVNVAGPLGDAGAE